MTSIRPTDHDNPRTAASAWRATRSRGPFTLRTTCITWLAILACLCCDTSQALAQTSTMAGSEGVKEFLTSGPETWTSPQGLTSALQVMLLLTVLSLAPAVLLMTTSFVRIIVVLGLLRQALGTQQLPPSQVITSLSLFMTLLIMTPVWKDVYDSAISPYTDPRSAMTLDEAWQRGALPDQAIHGPADQRGTATRTTSTCSTVISRATRRPPRRLMMCRCRFCCRLTC